jgi:hypothetical protein
MVLTEKPRIAGRHWPPEVDLIISALRAGETSQDDRRKLPRAEYRVKASLRLFSDRPETPHWVIYTCDVNERGLGFISPARLPLSHGGILEIPTPDGQTASIPVTLYRCSEVSPGWYRCALYFNREQSVFAHLDSVD